MCIKYIQKNMQEKNIYLKKKIYFFPSKLTTLMVLTFPEMLQL